MGDATEAEDFIVFPCTPPFSFCKMSDLNKTAEETQDDHELSEIVTEDEDDDTDDNKAEHQPGQDKERFKSALGRMESELAALDGDAENAVRAQLATLKARVEEIKKKRDRAKDLMAKQEKLLAKLDKRIDHMEGRLVTIDIPTDEAVQIQRKFYEKKIASLKKRVEQHESDSA